MQDRNTRAATIANSLLDVTATKARTADEALTSLAYAAAHICAELGIPMRAVVDRVREATHRTARARRHGAN